MHYLIIFFIGISGRISKSYDIKCPSAGQWKKRAESYCHNKENYACLLYVNTDIQQFTETCRGPRKNQPGEKTVMNNDNFNTVYCSSERYQPILFSTTQGRDCLFLKSNCSEEGQVIYSDGSPKEDRTCGCNYEKQYAFVSQHRDNACFCRPAVEDCTCYKKRCDRGFKLSPDYECIPVYTLNRDYNCKEITALEDKGTTKPTQTGMTEEMKKTERNIDQSTFYITLGLVCGIYANCECKCQRKEGHVEISLKIKLKFRNTAYSGNCIDLSSKEVQKFIEPIQADIRGSLKRTYKSMKNPDIQVLTFSPLSDGLLELTFGVQAKVSENIDESVLRESIDKDLANENNYTRGLGGSLVEIYRNVYFTIPLSDIDGIGGENVVLSCEVNNGSYHVKWFRNDCEIMADCERYRIVSDGKKHSLTITEANENDSGIYTAKCEDKTCSASVKIHGNDKFAQGCTICTKESSFHWCYECAASYCETCAIQHQKTQDHHIQHAQDKYTLDFTFNVNVSNVQDIKLLRNGLLCIADWKGRQLVTVDITSHEQQYIPLPDKPRCIAEVESHVVAVTFDYKIVTVEIKQRQIKNLKTFTEKCWRIVYSNNVLFVGCYDKTIKVLSMSGEIKRTIKLSFIPSYMCGSDDGSIYCTDGSNLYRMDDEGNIMFTYTPSAMAAPMCITTDNVGNVLIGVQESYNSSILSISSDGKKSQILVKHIPYKSWFPYISFIHQNNSLAVCRNGSIDVYKYVAI